MASYQFDIESDSDNEPADTGNYNSRTVILGGGRVSYAKQEDHTERKERKSDEPPPPSPPLKIADRIRPVSLPIERKHVDLEKKVDTDIPYHFKKIPWQLPKAPLDFPPPLDVPRIDGEKLTIPVSVGEYTLVNQQKVQPSRSARQNHLVMGPDKKNTRFCQFVKFDANKSEQSLVAVENRCRNGGCNFAHTMDVYAPLPCTYQAACNNGDICKFFHSNRETKFEYYMRCALFPPTPTPARQGAQRLRK